MRFEVDQRPQRVDPGQAIVPQGRRQTPGLVPAEGCYEWQKTEDGKKLPVQDQPGHDFDDRFQTLGADIVGRDGTEQEAGAPAVAR
jgi:hypothetical protein